MINPSKKSTNEIKTVSVRNICLHLNLEKNFLELGLTLHEVSDSDNLVYNSDYLHTLLLP